MHIFNDFGLAHWAENAPERIAVDDGRGALSYSQLAERAVSLAAYIEKKGISHEDRVLVCLPNCCEMVTLCFAAVFLGFTVVLGNIQHKQHELQHVVDMANPVLAILSEDRQVDILKEIAPNINVIKLDLIGRKYALDFVPEGRLENTPRTSADDPMLMVCTSGSTGQPKGVLMSRNNLLYSSLNVAERFRMTEDDVSFVPVPLCHMFGISGMLISVLTGGRLLLTRKFFADKALDLMEKEGVTVQYAVGTMYAREIACYEGLSVKPDLSQLRTGMIAGAPAVKAYISWFEDTLGCRLLNAYGMTEASSLAMADYDDSAEIRYNTCGRPCRYSQLAVIRENHSMADIGEPGEIVCKGSTVMIGYSGSTTEINRIFTDDGWFMTGDIGKRNADGTFTIVGRKKDLIIRGGYNVAPSEVEEVFYECESIREACAVGFPHEEYGEGIAVFVSLKVGAQTDIQQLMEFAAQNISKHKLPDKIILMDELPKLPNRKINRLELKKMIT